MKFLNHAINNVTGAVKKFQNKEFLDACIASCVLVASADGTIDASEKRKMSGIIKMTDELRVFGDTQVIDTFNHYVTKMEFDSHFGKTQLLKAIGEVTKDRLQAKTVMDVCCMIAAADGTVDDKEKALIREIADVLNIDISGYSILR